MKYQTSNLSREMALELWFKLHLPMESETINWRTYIDHDELAKLLGTNRKYISQVINQTTGLSLPSYLNIYRIDAFTQKIINGELKTKTIEGLAQEAGFDNRATFYRVFYCFKNQSPLEFIKSKKVIERKSKQVQQL